MPITHSPQPPQARIRHGLAYVNREKAILFGGIYFNSWKENQIDDVWTFNISNSQWEQSSVEPNMRASNGHGMCHFGNGKVLLFGGRNPEGEFLHETWVFKPETSSQKWTSKSQDPTVFPSARSMCQSMAYLGSNRAVLFGGWGPGYAPTKGKTWVYGYPISDLETDYDNSRQDFFDNHPPTDVFKEIKWGEGDKACEVKLQDLKHGVPDDIWKNKKFTDICDPINGTDPIVGTSLFKFLDAMPKGAILHLHPAAMGNFKNLLKHASEYKNGGQFYVLDLKKPDNATNNHPRSFFRFEKEQPSGYVPLKDRLHDKATLSKLYVTSDELKQARSSGDMWKYFQPIFDRIRPLLNQEELAKSYFEKACEHLKESNITHVELRTWWPIRGEAKIDTDINQLQAALNKNKDQLTYKVIYSRTRSIQGMEDIVDDLYAVGTYKANPNHSEVVGFDLFGEEDTGRPTSYFLDDIITAWERLGQKDLPPFYFHDGESDMSFQKSPDDDDSPDKVYFNNNMLDAYLLGRFSADHLMKSAKIPMSFKSWTRRVGHGLKLDKWSYLKQQYIQDGILIELCPISNQLLKYVDDLEEHPGKAYLTEGVPVSLNPDDPAMFGYQGVTHDFWLACMAWKLNLKQLKLLAYNSLKYSSLEGDYNDSNSEKGKAIQRWNDAWDTFVDQQNKK
ncbi:MAG: hypothetical protein ETSY1_03265 [Candidatus Entotheonella factor]|uniref:Adenosine deaminase domain-containing protein n=1 Tax=Entotheonella factor TaxID=1429438 RepID=W4LYS6_ENTF1|nr:MAG: hypothetical protein ETSY1_03265 [Candidatus Entotheonella factor]